MNIETFFNNIEKILRYLVPAFVLTILLRLFHSYYFDKMFADLSNIEFSIYFILSGLAIYSIHRVLFEFIDYKYLFKSDRKKISNYILSTFKGEDTIEIKKYFYYKMATIHSALLIAEVIFVYLIVTIFLSQELITHFLILLFIVINFIAWLFFLKIYRLYYYIQIDVFDKDSKRT